MRLVSNALFDKLAFHFKRSSMTLAGLAVSMAAPHGAVRLRAIQ